MVYLYRKSLLCLLKDSFIPIIIDWLKFWKTSRVSFCVTPKLWSQAIALGSNLLVGASVAGSVVTWTVAVSITFRPCVTKMLELIWVRPIDVPLWEQVFGFPLIEAFDIGALCTLRVTRLVRYFLLSPTTITLLTICKLSDLIFSSLFVSVFVF